jgi:hypothetical protein
VTNLFKQGTIERLTRQLDEQLSLTKSEDGCGILDLTDAMVILDFAMLSTLPEKVTPAYFQLTPAHTEVPVSHPVNYEDITPIPRRPCTGPEALRHLKSR